MKNTITAEVVVAYSLCPRKAFLLLEGKEKGVPHEYVQILEQQKKINQKAHLSSLKENNTVVPFNIENMKNRSELISKATLKSDNLQAYCDVLTKENMSSSLGRYSYEPTVIIGTYKVSKEDKLGLAFAGFVLGEAVMS